jgi:hypothetical protein
MSNFNDLPKEIKKPTPPQVPPRRMGNKSMTVTSSKPVVAAATATAPTGFVAKLFKKCKSATFQIDGQTYTIGECFYFVHKISTVPINSAVV